MHLSKIKLKNFRRLSDVTIDLNDEISIFVGANNSGKTSVAQAMHLLISGDRGRISFHDFSALKWSDVDKVEAGEDGFVLPEISMDLWFEVEEPDLHRVIDLLPSLSWSGSYVGVRVLFAPSNADESLARYQARREEAQKASAGIKVAEGEEPYVAPPRSFREYLQAELQREYEFRYFVLDEAKFDEQFESAADYEPQELLREQGRTGKDILGGLIKVDFLHAQRHLSDNVGGSRAEELSRHLSRYYARNLERRAEDHEALRALAISEEKLNDHLENVFKETLDRLSGLGYPGFTNPEMKIRSALNPATVMSSQDGTHVHYALGPTGSDLTLPDKYNGLGFKNLIYMVVELLDLHAQWLAIEADRPPLHLVFVEEPEAHLHAQLQQVFVNKVLDILTEEADDPDQFRTQLVLTTHSTHILYERGFTPIRYFRRESTGVQQSTKVLNLSEFYEEKAEPTRDFLERYLKLTHCDLFFADAAVLVEGNVERLLMPQMIESAAPGLRSTYLSVLEIGGAFGHQFRSLIDFLGITTLIITDLDSVAHEPVTEEAEDDEEGELVELEDDNAEGEPEKKIAVQKRKACTPETVDAETSNQTLIKWLPAKKRIDELLLADTEEKQVEANDVGLGAVRVTYPCTVILNWQGDKVERAGRTLEAAFAFENLDWTQSKEQRDLGLLIRNPADIDALANRLHDKIQSSSFKKTDFALALLAKDPAAWNVPTYICEGLRWLEKELDVQEDKPTETSEAA